MEKSRGGKSQRREEKKKEDQRREEKRREGKGREEKRRRKKKEDQGRERVRRKSQKKEDAGARKGRKVGSLKRQVRSHLSRWEMKNCMLSREAHFEVKSVKKWWARTTFGSWDVKKEHAVLARSTCPSQHVQSTSEPDRFWKSGCWKNAHYCGTTFWSWDVVLRGRRKGFCTWPKVSKTWRFCSSSKTDGRHDIWRGSAKMHFAWQAQYKRHVHQRC